MIFFVFLINATMGNLVTSFFYRLPRNIPIHRDSNPPMCSNCGHKLSFFEYIPLFHVLRYGFVTKCCQAKIPYVYTVIELFVAVYNTIIYYNFGFSNIGIFIMLIVPVLTCIIFVLFYHHFIPKDLIWASVLCLFLYKIYVLKYDLSNLLVFCFVSFMFLMIIEKHFNYDVKSDLRIMLTLGVGFFSFLLPLVLLAWVYFCHKKQVNYNFLVFLLSCCFIGFLL